MTAQHVEEPWHRYRRSISACYDEIKDNVAKGPVIELIFPFHAQLHKPWEKVLFILLHRFIPRSGDVRIPADRNCISNCARYTTRNVESGMWSCEFKCSSQLQVIYRQLMTSWWRLCDPVVHPTIFLVPGVNRYPRLSNFQTPFSTAFVMLYLPSLVRLYIKFDHKMFWSPFIMRVLLTPLVGGWV